VNLTLKTAPTKDVIAIEEVKAMVGLETDQKQFDALLKSMITAAANTFEVETNTRLMEQSWLQYFEDWPLEEDYFEIGYPPLISVTAIKYTDSGDESNTWASSQYDVDINPKPGRVFLSYNLNFPSATLTPSSNAIEVEFKCGYENQEKVPYDIQTAIKLLVEFWFTNRGEATNKVPSYILDMIQKYRIYYL
jgi:uncharacterized phiE125 gp8 family phage protein